MSQTASTYSIQIQTAANMAGVQAVNTGLQQTVAVTNQAAQAGQALVVSHNAAAAAAQGHAQSNGTLRLAARGANDAAFALTDLMNGNFITALHRGKFAVEDIGIALKSAFAPTLVIVGITLLVEALGHYVMASNEASEATKEHGKETEKTTEKVFDLNKALREQAQETEALADPTKAAQHSLDEFDKIAARVTDSSKVLKEVFEEVQKASASLDKAVEERIKRLDTEVSNTKKLIDAERDLLKARIALTEKYPDDVSLKQGMADKRADLAKIDVDARHRAAKELIQQTAVVDTQNRADMAKAGAEQARAALKASGFELAVKDAADAGVTFDKLTSGKDFEALADAVQKKMGGAGATTEGVMSAEIDADKLRAAGKLFDEAQTKSRAADMEQQAAAREKAKLEEMKRENAPLAEIDAKHTETIDTELQVLYKKQAEKQTREANERSKKQLEEYLKVNGQSPEEAKAAAQDLLANRTDRSPLETARNDLFRNRQEAERRLGIVNTRLDVGTAPNAAEAAGRTAFDQQAQAQAAFNALPPNQRAAAEALDATHGLANGSTVSGNIAQQINAHAQELLKGNNQQGNMQAVMQLLEQLVAKQKENHQDTSRTEARLQQLQREVEQMNARQRNMRQ